MRLTGVEVAAGVSVRLSVGVSTATGVPGGSGVGRPALPASTVKKIAVGTYLGGNGVGKSLLNPPRQPLSDPRKKIKASIAEKPALFFMPVAARYIG
jgi:hypothetical protein